MLSLGHIALHQRLLAPAEVEPQAVSVVPLTEAAIELGKAGLGMKVMTGWATRPYLDPDQLRSVRVGPEGLVLPYRPFPPPDHSLYFGCFLNALRQEIRR